MPLTHTRCFRVRYYECNALGHVTQANYLRYMQETAFDASAAAGYSFARYVSMGRLWLVRETDIEFLRPLQYGDSVEVTTWVLDFRRVRSRRAYEFRLCGSPGLVASAQTDWAFLNLERERPVPIPEDMQAAFWPEGVPGQAPARGRFPGPPPPPPGALRQRRRVEWRDLDPAQHVNNATYLDYLDHAGAETAAACGWPSSRLLAEDRLLTAQSVRIAYQQPAFLGDELEIAIWHSDPQTMSLIRHCEIHRVSDAALVARARSVLILQDLGSRQPTALPEHFVADLAATTSGGPEVECLGDRAR